MCLNDRDYRTDSESAGEQSDNNKAAEKSPIVSSTKWFLRFSGYLNLFSTMSSLGGNFQHSVGWTNRCELERRCRKCGIKVKLWFSSRKGWVNTKRIWDLVASGFMAIVTCPPAEESSSGMEAQFQDLVFRFGENPKMAKQIFLLAFSTRNRGSSLILVVQSAFWFG